jgi:Pyruvate/2-oxoacid:ferredoxin oxidoreductase delta subunit
MGKIKEDALVSGKQEVEFGRMDCQLFPMCVMSLGNTMNQAPRILFCNCTYAQVLPRDVKATVLRQLCDAGVAFEAVGDLCEAAARRDPVMADVARGPAKIAACFPRAVKWLFGGAGAPLSPSVTGILNMRVESAELVGQALLHPVTRPDMAGNSAVPPREFEQISGASQGREAREVRGGNALRIILYEGPAVQPLSAADRYELVSALLERGSLLSCVRGEISELEWGEGQVLILAQLALGRSLPWEASGLKRSVKVLNLSDYSPADLMAQVDQIRSESKAVQHGVWKSWFPVIDYDRCTHCMQCLSFCLFGVYGVDSERHIEVQNREQCKTHCPACARVCPEAAILFPKYKTGPINGDTGLDSDLQREKMKIDISALLGGDIYQILRARSERAQSRFSKERDSDKALQERQRCLQQLIKAGDIPVEALMSLPSPEEIQRRAQEAMERARAAAAKSGQ